MCLDLDDNIVKRARNKRIAKYTRVGTNFALWSVFGALIINGTIGIDFLKNMIIVGAASRGTKYVVRNRKVIINKVKEIQL